VLSSKQTEKGVGRVGLGRGGYERRKLIREDTSAAAPTAGLEYRNLGGGPNGKTGKKKKGAPSGTEGKLRRCNS